jgi:prefoldin subunit 5
MVARSVMICLEHGKVESSDEDECCVTCGRDLVHVDDIDSASTIKEEIDELKGERDGARRELAELEAKTNHLHAALEAPENADKTLTELYVELWGKP